ncbi:hypothetical protein AN958_00435 [Leucoagaricus sp. SymC.cos]|nr:hypothetical protein AN958_00435 [Leucoagaricus sp. SymC.cos]
MLVKTAFSPVPNSKRKRSRARPEEPQPLTPNPRSKKQPKQRETPSPLKPKRVVVQSPHAHNPTADYIPPTITDADNPRPLLSRRSRSTSATPIPPYEPPTDIFTPPKEVFVTPVTATIKVSKSSKRKSTVKKKKHTPASFVVKLEMPDVDLNAPMPPPSPGDDPLLLSSSVEPELRSSTPTKSRSRALWMDSEDDEVSAGRRTISPTHSLPFQKLRFDDLPPSSPDESVEQPPPPIIEEEDLDITPPDMPFFELGDNANVDGGWSDDEGGDLPMLPPPDTVKGSPTKEGEGEFTGKWLEVLVKTKADPPSSATRGRMDEWGNPKSPFPLGIQETTGAVPVREEGDSMDSPGALIQEGSSAEDAFKLMGNRPHEDDDQDLPEDEDISQETQITADEDAQPTSIEEDDIPPLPETDEGDELPIDIPAPISPEQERHVEEEYSSLPSLPGDSAPSPDIVKITSADPRAAARAAAILKQHNYDCFTKLELKRQQKRRRITMSPSEVGLRRGVLSGGIEKRERERRKTVMEVSLSLSANMSLLSMDSPNPFALRSFMKTKGLTPKVPMTPGETCYDPLTGERMWTKEEWKRLDACFTDERLEVGLKMELGEMEMASVDEVKLEDVVQKFVEWMGGWEDVEEFGPEWSRENLMSRTKALRNKQRKGNVAPPTSLPFSPNSASNSKPVKTARKTIRSMAPLPFDFSFADRSVEMDVPEFTPIRTRPALMPSASEKAVPATLLAPRYSHLLEEAKKISKDLPNVEGDGEEREVVESDTALEEGESEDSPTATTLVDESERSLESDVVQEEEDTLEQTQEQQEAPLTTTTTIGGRVKGLLFSYLPTLRKTPSSSHSTTISPSYKDKLKSRQTRPGLPLPPKEVLERQRGPVITPAREPIPKPIHPKELVALQQAPPVLPPASKIPRVVHPKQLVELHHVTPKVAHGERRRERRSSGASVKDLIKGFEKMEQEQEQEREKGKGKERGGVRRMKSVGEWRKDVGARVSEERPVWKP